MTSRDIVATGASVHLRQVQSDDLAEISKHKFTVSIAEPHGDMHRLGTLFAKTGFWGVEAGAAAIVEIASGRMVGTAQFYRSGPCIHGLELGYIIHRESDRGQGYASEAARLLSDYLFAHRPGVHRHQLLIEVDNIASTKVADHCGFQKEGVLRKCGFDPDDPSDDYLYSRTRDDYQA
jgi:ribosomal-protein-alanine N-acetyltransferase